MAKARVENPPKFNFPDDFRDISPFLGQCDATDSKGRYLHWSQFKWRVEKEDAENLWKAVKFKRMTQYKQIGLKDEKGIPFVYCTPHSMEATLYQLVKITGGNVGAVAGSTASDSLQNKFLVSSLIMEEAITSAQLEGASTTREVAKKMLEEEREPVDEDERMILNNYLLLKYAEQKSKDELTLDMILEFHRIATQGTTENNVVPGEFRVENDIFIEDGDGNVAHQPPDFMLIEERLKLLCEFANQDHSGQGGCDFVHPLIKAIVLHFMIGYEHPFRDGNGRTARALFYWFMLKSEYRLFKYISISKLLKEKPKEYGLSYMYTEKDDNDLTYFIYYQLDTIYKAFGELENYLDNKVYEYKKISESLEKTAWGNILNFIQKDLIKKAVKEPGRIFTIKEVSKSYSISDNTSRSHLNKLTELRLFLSTKDGKKTIFIAPSDLLQKLNSTAP
ncbi:Fic family protein [Alteromonas mediterranea]|jgi:Fic family protein|uniref:Fic family protein n=1 Tax=Alteromonas mediterranea TaxID=314275 RepID=UPI000B707D2D|nr:Fic family protein [Alteromonas mediterranea]|tara:strand:+ start:1753 stop:3099 length:1347 start_codon:yes stop_codon:yes gene_type:complete